MVENGPKYNPVSNPNTSISSHRDHCSFFRAWKSTNFVYGVVLIFVLFTLFAAFSPVSSPLPLFSDFRIINSASVPITSPDQSPSILSRFFPDSPNFIKPQDSDENDENYSEKQSDSDEAEAPTYETKTDDHMSKSEDLEPSYEPRNEGDLIGELVECDLYDGEWVRDESYPLYEPGSCWLIDGQFDCFRNGRPDHHFLKYKWKPYGCTLPRFDGDRMLEFLKGKRLVFVGDSLNRNMWESLICLLRNSAQNKDNIYEASGKQHFKNDVYFSFVFKDYNFTLEFFTAPFLVQPGKYKDEKGLSKETLRLDIFVRDNDKFKDVDFLVFNTGHWWNHEKTSKGEGYYQEGDHVYEQLDVVDAYQKALTTWGKWIDTNINPNKTHVLFRGYSIAHFSGGKWNSGGHCDTNKEPTKKETELEPYLEKMKRLELVLKEMKTSVSYLNISRLSDYRKDAHPSIYRVQNPPSNIVQDCSHWCLPGVPDIWNELLFAELLRMHYKNRVNTN